MPLYPLDLQFEKLAETAIRLNHFLLVFRSNQLPLQIRESLVQKRRVEPGKSAQS
jgi:hypothetical protein